MKRFCVVAVLVCGVSVAAGLGGMRGAGAGAAPAGGRAGVVPAAPPGWTVVQTGRLLNLPHTQSRGQANCPSGTVAWGGGVGGGGTGIQRVNSSFPVVSGGLAVAWAAHMNNVGSHNEAFRVYALCAAKPKNYTVAESAAIPGTPGLSVGQQPCPLSKLGKPLKALAGGVLSSAGTISPEQDLNASSPQDGGWAVTMNTHDQFPHNFNVFVICGSRTGYRVVTGPPVPAYAASTTFAGVDCPVGKVETGGGVTIFDDYALVTMNSSFPTDPAGWANYVNNPGNGVPLLTPYAVCVD
jgi:hypothetical protein